MPADQPPPPGQEGDDHRRPAGGPAHRSSKRGGSRWAPRIERRLTAADRQQGRPRRDAQSGGGGREASQYRRTAHAHDSTPPPRGRWFHNEPGSYSVGHSHAPGAVIKPASSGRSGQVEGRRLGEKPQADAVRAVGFEPTMDRSPPDPKSGACADSATPAGGPRVHRGVRGVGWRWPPAAGRRESSRSGVGERSGNGRNPPAAGSRGSPGTRTQNLRIKSPLLCQIELATRRQRSSGGTPDLRGTMPSRAVAQLGQRTCFGSRGSPVRIRPARPGRGPAHSLRYPAGCARV